MRIEATGIYLICSNHEQKEFDLAGMECSNYDGDSYIAIRDFDYAKIFKDVLNKTGREGYEIPADKESFDKSPLWADLGFDVADDFEITRIDMDLMIEYYMTYGQKAGYRIDMGSKEVKVNRDNMVKNAIDNQIFEDWPTLLDDEECEVDAPQLVDDLVNIFSRYNSKNNLDADDMDEDVRRFLGKFKTEDGDPLDEEEIEAIVEILRSKLLR